MSSKKTPITAIGIAGGTGSGKTTVASAISRNFDPSDICILSHDCYYKEFKGLTKAEKDKLNFDHLDSLDNELFVEHLINLKQGYPVEVPVYDFTTHSRKPETKLLIPTKIIIVEGILIFAEPRIRQLLDIKIFVDTDADLRILRRIQRDIKERGRTFESVVEQYIHTVRPMHLEFVEPSKRYADLIVPEGGYNQKALEMLINGLKGVL